MKLYPNVNVDLTFQNCGTKWLMILAGSEQDIESVFAGLYNMGATNNKQDDALTYTTHDHTQATFWSSPEKMFNFFFSSHCLKHNNSIRHANTYAHDMISRLKLEQRTFYNYNREVFVDSYGVGTKSAERPDNDFRDAVLNHAYKDKSSVKETEKMLADKN